MQCCTINSFARSYSSSFGCLFWKLFSFCQAGLYLTPTTPGNVLKEDMAMKEVVLRERFSFFQCKISVEHIVSTVSGMDSLP